MIGCVWNCPLFCKIRAANQAISHEMEGVDDLPKEVLQSLGPVLSFEPFSCVEDPF